MVYISKRKEIDEKSDENYDSETHKGEKQAKNNSETHENNLEKYLEKLDKNSEGNVTISKPRKDFLKSLSDDENKKNKAENLLNLFKRWKTYYSTSIEKVKAIGDLHGWAPGLITYLISNQLAKIYINNKPMFVENNDGLKIDENELKRIFRDPKEYISKNLPFPDTRLHYNYTNETNENIIFQNVKAEWIAPKNVAFVQMGDIFDRGDYSEISCEILRQLLIQAPFRVFVLMGNHEQFLVESNYLQWIYNEDRFAYQENSARSAFHTLFSQNIDDQNDKINDIKKYLFNRDQKFCLSVYFTQFYAQILYLDLLKKDKKISISEILEKNISKFSEILKDYEDKMHKNPKDIILDLEKPDFEVFLKIRESILVKHSDRIFLGGITILAIGNTIFTHGEPTCFIEGSEKILEPSIIRFDSINCAYRFYEFSKTKDKLTDSDDFHLLWERGASNGITRDQLHPIATEHMKTILKIFSGVRHYVHGHSPITTVAAFQQYGNFPISYLARNFGTRPNMKTGNVRIHVIDEGITPIYYRNEERLYDPTRIPFGLKLHKDLEKFQDLDLKNTLIEEKKEDWIKKTDNYEFSDFSVPTELQVFNETKLYPIQPGMAIWKYFENHVNRSNVVSDNQFDLNLPQLPNYRLYREESHQEDNSISFLIYNAELPPLLEPNRLYLKSEGQNIDLDLLVYEMISENVLTWFKDNLHGAPIPILNSTKKNEFIENLFVPEEKLEKAYKGVELYGLPYLIKYGFMVYVKIFISKNDKPVVFIINNFNKDLELKVKIFSADQKESELIVRSEKQKWKLEIFKKIKVEDLLTVWDLDLVSKNNDIPIDNKEQIIKASESDEILNILNKIDGICAVSWIQKGNISIEEKGAKEGSVNEFFDFSKTNHTENQNRNNNGVTDDQSTDEIYLFDEDDTGDDQF